MSVQTVAVTVYASPRTVGALVGFGGVGLATVVFLALDNLPTTVPALVLLLPIIGAALIADWRVAMPVAAVAGALFSFDFLPPTGTIRVGFTQMCSWLRRSSPWRC